MKLMEFFVHTENGFEQDKTYEPETIYQFWTKKTQEKHV